MGNLKYAGFEDFFVPTLLYCQDWPRDGSVLEERVISINYDPNRDAQIALTGIVSCRVVPDIRPFLISGFIRRLAGYPARNTV